MDKNILNDNKLDELGFIKDINLYDIVDEEFDKKREKKRIKNAILISTLIITFISLTVCILFVLSKINFEGAKIIKLLVSYYFITVSAMMILIIPITKRMKSN